MSKLFYRLNSLIKYLKYNNLLNVNYEPFILKIDDDVLIIEEYKKLITLFDDNNNYIFKNVYINYVYVYEQELLDNEKRKKAKNAKIKLLKEYCNIYGDDTKPTDQYIYKNVELSNDLKPYMNLSTQYIE